IALQAVEIEHGTGSGRLRLVGSVWPPDRPRLDGRLKIEAARLVFPGLNEAVRVPHAEIELNGERILADPIVAEIGGTSFAGSVEHNSSSLQPWRFDLRTNRLSLEEASQWFEALGRPAPHSLLDHIPGLSSLGSRRSAALSLFRAVNTEGLLSGHSITY